MKWEIHPSALLKAHSVHNIQLVLLKAALMLENCRSDPKKGITYKTIPRWPNLAGVDMYLSSQPNAFLRLHVMVCVEINATSSVASKNFSMTSWKAEIYHVYFTLFKPSSSQSDYIVCGVEWELTAKRRSGFKTERNKFTEDRFSGVHIWSRYAGDCCKLTKFAMWMII